MKKLLLAVLAVCSFGAAKACTNFIATKGATTDGSVFVTYSADDYGLFTNLCHYAAGKHAKGTKREIIDYDSGESHGFIDEAAETYNVIGNINEYQLSIGETTYGGREEMIDKTGIIDYGSLMYLGLQRAKTAREAIKVMTELVEKYGYQSSGESFTIADPNEVWILEMMGCGGDKKQKVVWVAVRIPDGMISGHANQARIGQFSTYNTDVMTSKNCIKFAREKGWFTGNDKDFNWKMVYAAPDFGGRRYCDARVWSFFNHFKDMSRYLPWALGKDKNAEDMPLWIQPDRKLTLADMQMSMRDHYEGTPMDMTQDIGAGPYSVPYRWRPMSWEYNGKTYFNERAIATQQTGFVLVAQLRPNLPDEVGGILWFGVDDANTAVFTPMYASIQRTPECYRVGNGDMMHFSWTSAFWIHNWVANMAYARYAPMIQDIRPVQYELEDGFDNALAQIDAKAVALLKESPVKARAFLTNYSCTVADAATARWKSLGEYLLVKYMDGNMKKEENGSFKDNGHGLSAMPEFPGYDTCYYKQIVDETGNKFLSTGGGH